MNRALPLLVAWLGCTSMPPAHAAAPPQFTPLVAVDDAKIVAAAEAYPGGRYEAENLLEPSPSPTKKAEYASAGKGTDTFVDFDLGRPVRLVAFRHVERRDPATVVTAELILSDTADFSEPLATIPVRHANKPAATTLATFEPHQARFVRWKVTEVASHSTVGGDHIGFFAAGEPEASPSRVALRFEGRQAIVAREGRRLQPYRVALDYDYVEPCQATLDIPGADPIEVTLRPGGGKLEAHLPPVERDTTRQATIKVDGAAVAHAEFVARPVRPWTLYLVPHSHVDIGYTHRQDEVERLQWQHFETAIELARKTADYPPPAQFKWNVEVMWALDSYLREASPEKRAAFFEAVEKGWVGLDALYGNELTGLCRPEELFQLTECARRISREHGVKIESAMISDVPGYTWGIVPALAHSGVRYLSMGPNPWHRIGGTIEAWGDRPFWWVSPSGEERVLCWVAGKSYAWFHGGLLGRIKQAGPEPLLEYVDELTAGDYPYDMVKIRYTIGGDNGPPDADLPAFVQFFNGEFVVPQLEMATNIEFFRRFEKRYGDQVPEVRGDFTPYWEDGAGSSAAETALARNAAERLVQTDTLWCMLHSPADYPADRVYAAWRNVLLYNEHTWGAHCSISQPNSQFTLDQWAVKRQFAVDAQQQSQQLQDEAIRRLEDEMAKPAEAAAKQKEDAPDPFHPPKTCVDVFNTCSWPRSELVVWPGNVNATEHRGIFDENGNAFSYQRLGSGELVFLARDVPALGAKRFFLRPGRAMDEKLETTPTSLQTERLRVQVDAKTGAITGLTTEDLPADLVDRDGGGLNDYVYVAGRDGQNQQRVEQVDVKVVEDGPLVAQLLITGPAPGCSRMSRVVQLVEGLDFVDIRNVLSKQAVLEKEAVHLGFAFDVPDGQMRVDTPWAVVRPEVDQLPGACRNYLSVGRWVDVSNEQFGVTWATLDAPLIEVGDIRMDVAGPLNPSAFLAELPPSQRFFSYLMNNYWETNYKASQQGAVVFRFAVRPHAGPFDAAAAARFGAERSQPLIVVPVTDEAPKRDALLTVEGDGVVVTSVRPSPDRQALIVRLHNAGQKPTAATVRWREPAPVRVTLSSPLEADGQPVDGPIQLPPMGIATLRATLAE